MRLCSDVQVRKGEFFAQKQRSLGKTLVTRVEGTKVRKLVLQRFYFGRVWGFENLNVDVQFLLGDFVDCLRGFEGLSVRGFLGKLATR